MKKNEINADVDITKVACIHANLKEIREGMLIEENLSHAGALRLPISYFPPPVWSDVVVVAVGFFHRPKREVSQLQRAEQVARL